MYKILNALMAIINSTFRNKYLQLIENSYKLIWSQSNGNMERNQLVCMSRNILDYYLFELMEF